MAGMCDTCHAGCCRSYHLIITAYDALGVSRDLGLPTGEFTTLLGFRPEQRELLKTKFQPARLSDPGCEGKEYFLVLKRVPSALVPGSRKCYFLHEWQRTFAAPNREGHPGKTIVGRCGIYSSRPLMCRVFPTAFHTKPGLGFIATPRPVDIPERHEIHTLCPETWTAEQFSDDHTQVLHTLAIHEYEIEFYNQVIEVFNAEPRRAEDYFPFMARAYANRFRTVHGPPLAAGEAPAPQAENAEPPA